MQLINWLLLTLPLLFGQISIAAPSFNLTAPRMVTVRTKTEHNSNAVVWYRMPKGVKTDPARMRRVLVIFGGRNCSGKAEVSNMLGWADWADRNDVVLVAPGFKDDDYWHPEKWSGAALMAALDEIGKAYPIRADRLLYYGYSAGSQASNLFAAWRPNLCRAWVSHACGVFHEPSSRMRDVPGVVTCGDADAVRCVLSRDFVAKASAVGERAIWKSFPNHPHDVPPGSLALARAFLTHYHLRHRSDLYRNDPLRRDVSAAPFVGDEPEGVFHPSGSAQERNIPAEDRVRLPSLAVALAWGRTTTERPNDRLNVDGVDFTVRVPSAYTPKSRVVVVIGGRGWSGDETLTRINFDRLADARQCFLLSPSFVQGEYWQPESGTGATLLGAVREVQERYDLERSEFVIYGYSAGGQCAALFSEWLKGSVLAWGAHACGVYPRTVPSARHILITCGTGDEDRLRISRDFVYAAREQGASALFRAYPCGHELSPSALALARAWLSAVVAAPAAPKEWGEDDTFKTGAADVIDVEFRNPLYTPEIRAAWLNGR